MSHKTNPKTGEVIFPWNDPVQKHFQKYSIARELIVHGGIDDPKEAITLAQKFLEAYRKYG